MVDEKKLNNFLEKMVGDMGAAVSGALVLIGDKLGLYKALADSDRTDSTRLAEITGTSERYVREWLAAQAASGYIEYDAGSGEFYMTPEQVAVFADEESPALMTGGFYSLSSVFQDEPLVTEAFRTGEGVAWGEHDGCLFCGTAKFFRPAYRANLISSWIPSLDGVEEKLKEGALVADVGCGHGISTILMAEAYPEARFIGFDFHPPSIEHARERARKAGLDNVTFEVAAAKSFPGNKYDLVTFFDCLHDMGDPIGAARHVRQSLDRGGTWMIVEPFAHDELEKNLNPVGRVYYGFSATVCTPSALSQEVGMALGAQAGESQLKEIIASGGFSQVRKATETPFNMILEARP